MINLVQKLSYINPGRFIQSKFYMYVYHIKAHNEKNNLDYWQQILQLCTFKSNYHFWISDCPQKQFADEVSVGKIWRGDPQNPWIEAMAVSADTLMAVAKKADMQKYTWIDSVTKDTPVWINRIDGHMCLANSAALKLAGITNEVKEVKGVSKVLLRVG